MGALGSGSSGLRAGSLNLTRAWSSGLAGPLGSRAFGGEGEGEGVRGGTGAGKVKVVVGPSDSCPFNTAGPSRRGEAYFLDPLSLYTDTRTSAFNLDSCSDLIKDKKYFVLHGPRQSMKTSFLLALENHVNSGGLGVDTDGYGYTCVLASCARRQERADNGPDVCKKLARRIANMMADDAGSGGGDGGVAKGLLSGIPESSSELLSEFLKEISRDLYGRKKKFVLLLDEFDTLTGDPLLYVLGQLREDYPSRPSLFPSTIVLVGMRDLQEYKVDGEAVIGGASPFNITSKSSKTLPFTREHVEELYGQHTEHTGQAFTEAAIDRVMYWTEGQPWLVNKIGELACFDGAHAVVDRSVAVDLDTVDGVAWDIIYGRDTHVGSLGQRLKEPRIAGPLADMMAGISPHISAADIELLMDLGIVKNRELEPAHGILKRLIPRFLFDAVKSASGQGVAELRRNFLKADGQVNMEGFMSAFYEYFILHKGRHRGRYLEEHLPGLLAILMIGIVNGHGNVAQEVVVGSYRADLLVDMPCVGGADNEGARHRIVIEVKVCSRGARGKHRDFPVKDLEQVRQYAEKIGCLPTASLTEHIVVFDRHQKKRKAGKTGKYLADKLYYEKLVLPRKTSDPETVTGEIHGWVIHDPEDTS